MGEEIKTTTDRDAELVASCVKGDVDAFEALASRHRKRMFNIAYRLTGNCEEASEIVQDAFLAAYRGLKSFRGRAKFSTWLTAITVNHSKNRLNRLKIRRDREPVSLDDPVLTDDGEVVPDPPSHGPSALDHMEQREVREKVQACIDALEPGFREVIVLRDMQDCSYEEIGGMLKLREGTVKSRLARAREAVRECLKKALGML